MNWLTRVFAHQRRYDELSAAIGEHLEEKIANLMDRGVQREEAKRTARREFGNVTLIEQRSREVWQWPAIESIFADLCFSLRQFREAPGFTFTVIFVLALGVAASVSIFAFVNAALLRPLPETHGMVHSNWPCPAPQVRSSLLPCKRAWSSGASPRRPTTLHIPRWF